MCGYGVEVRVGAEGTYRIVIYVNRNRSVVVEKISLWCHALHRPGSKSRHGPTP